MDWKPQIKVPLALGPSCRTTHQSFDSFSALVEISVYRKWHVDWAVVKRKVDNWTVVKRKVDNWALVKRKVNNWMW